MKRILIVPLIAGLVLMMVAPVMALEIGLPSSSGVHLESTGVQWTIAMVFYLLTLMVVFGNEWLQEKVVPHAKELGMITKKWKQDQEEGKETLTVQGSILALSWAVDTFARLLLLAFIVSALATPLG